MNAVKQQLHKQGLQAPSFTFPEMTGKRLQFSKFVCI